MGGLAYMTEASIANIPCGASISCGDGQKILAYPLSVTKKSRTPTGLDRAIGARIREARERLGVTITDLGLAFGGTRQKVQFWETGKNFPPVSDLRRLCELLRVDANSLLGMHEMKSLNEHEIISARNKILALAMAA